MGQPCESEECLTEGGMNVCSDSVNTGASCRPYCAVVLLGKRRFCASEPRKVESIDYWVQALLWDLVLTVPAVYLWCIKTCYPPYYCSQVISFTYEQLWDTEVHITCGLSHTVAQQCMWSPQVTVIAVSYGFLHDYLVQRMFLQHTWSMMDY